MRKWFPWLVLAIGYCIFRELDMIDAGKLPSWFRLVVVGQGALEAFLVWRMAMSGSSRLAPPSTYRAYLVLHLDIKRSPPVVTFADVYSASAQDLTSIGGEAHVDLYSLTGESYHQACEELMQVIPLYFSWVVPLLTRSR